MTVSISKPVRLFYSYSHRDEELRRELETHLALLQNTGMIDQWHDRKIGAGDEWAGQIDANLESADIILLLVSSDFLASRYCYDVEMERALKRHDAGEARVIPIVIRPVDWEGAPFARLQMLPTDAKPVTGPSWHSRDQAWEDVAHGIRVAVRAVAAKKRRAPGGTGGDGVAGEGATLHKDRGVPPSQTQRHARKATHPLVDKLDAMRDRFRTLLDAHHVPLSAVPVLLRDFDFPLSALDDDDRLSDLLTEDLIAFMCDTFHVERAWLRGESQRATLHRRAWYKCPDAFCVNLVARRATNPRVRVHFIKDVKPQSRLRELFGQDKLDAGVIIETEHSPVAGVTFSTYERCEEQAWTYWKSRLFYKGVILFCDQAQERHGLEYSGDVLTSDAFTRLSAGTLLPVAALSSGTYGHWSPWEYVSTDYVRARETDELARVRELFQGWALGTYLTPALWASPSGVGEQ